MLGKLHYLVVANFIYGSVCVPKYKNWLEVDNIIATGLLFWSNLYAVCNVTVPQFKVIL